MLLPSSPGSCCRAAGPLVLLPLAGSGSRCIRCSSGSHSPFRTVAQSTSSCRSSLSVGLRLVPRAPRQCLLSRAAASPPLLLQPVHPPQWVALRLRPGVGFLARPPLLVAALFARCCLASAFAFLTVEVLPGRLPTACLSLLAFNFRRMRRALASSLWTSCGKRII